MPVAASRSSERRAALLITCTMVCLNTLSLSSVNIALPAIGRDFGLSAVALGWVVNVFPLAAAVLLIPLGKIADMYGRKRVLTLSVSVFAVTSFLQMISWSGTALLVFRILQGVGAAMLYTTGPAILTSVFPPEDRGKVLGIYVASTYLGVSSGPLLGGVLTDSFGWRSVFAANVPLGLIVLAAIFWKLRGEWAGARRERFDIGGSIIYGLSLAAVIIGFSFLPGIVGIWLLVAGGVGAVVFIRWEARASSPVLDLNLFRGNPTFTLSHVAVMMSYAAISTVTFMMSLYLQYTRGLSAKGAGVILIAMPVTQALFSPVAGRLSDRIEPRVLASAGMAVTAVGLGLMSLLEQGTGIGFVLGSLVVVGLGFALFSSPNVNAIMSSVDKSCYAVASATVATVRQIGHTLSVAVAMLVFTLYMGQVQVTPEYYPAFLASMKTGFIIFTVLCIVGMFASLARGKVKAEVAEE